MNGNKAFGIRDEIERNAWSALLGRPTEKDYVVITVAEYQANRDQIKKLQKEAEDRKKARYNNPN